MPEGMNYIRTPELLKRWSEFSAFGFGTYYCYFFTSKLFEFGLAPLLYACSRLYIRLPARINDSSLLNFFCRFVPHAHRILHVTSGCPSVRQCREYGTFCGVCWHLWSVERVPLGADAGGGGDRPSVSQVSDSFFAL